MSTTPTSTFTDSEQLIADLQRQWADDAVKASRHALEVTLRVLLAPFQPPNTDRRPVTPALILAGTADALLGPTVQRAIAAEHPGSQVIELDCVDEFLIEAPSETAKLVVRFIARLPRRKT